MRKINKIIIHCSATKEGQDINAVTIDEWHRKKGFNEIGYHFVVKLDGTIERGRSIDKIGAHCVNNNSDSIGICYIGGLDSNGKAKDTRTQIQKESLIWLIKILKEILNSVKEVKGHRDYSPDKNKDGKITKEEWLKDCPCFDAYEEYKNL